MGAEHSEPTMPRRYEVVRILGDEDFDELAFSLVKGNLASINLELVEKRSGVPVQIRIDRLASYENSREDSRRTIVAGKCHDSEGDEFAFTGWLFAKKWMKSSDEPHGELSLRPANN